MATKEKPGKFDCYANAKPDEPMFTLLARDPLAPLIVGIWAAAREFNEEQLEKCFSNLVRFVLIDDRNKPKQEKIIEALEVARDMIEWKQRNPDV